MEKVGEGIEVGYMGVVTPVTTTVSTSNNPFLQSTSYNAPKPDPVTHIRKLMAELPAKTFEELFDTLENEGF